jgi:NUMOD4 motif-containing protein
MKLEIFKPINGYEGLYEVSNFGRIKSLAKRWSNGYKEETIMSLTENKKNYITVRLSKDGIKETFYVHILVAKHFIKNPNKLPEVNHKDFIRSNNMVDNLEWKTKIGNIKYSVIAGRIRGWRGENSPRANHTNERVLKIRELYESGSYTQNQLADMFNVKRHNISKIILRQRWAHI